MTGIMTLLSEMSSQAVWLGLDVAAKATVVLLLAVAVSRLLNGRVLARAAVWNALLVGLILLPPATALFPRLRICCLPPTPTAATVEIPAESPPPAETAVPDEVLTAPDQDQNSLLSFLATGFGEGHSLTDQRATAVDPESVSPQDESKIGVGDPSYIAPNPATSSPRWPGIILCIYLLGVAIPALRLTLSFLAVRRLRGQSIPLEDSKWTAALAAWRERLGIRQAVQLGVSSAVNVPIQIGWLRPMVILPAEMIAALEPARHGSILLHELAHVRRRDYAWQILLKLVQIIYWPHPLIWLAGRMIGANREQVCDDLCVHHSSSAGQYRATLLEVASALVRRPAASLGIAMARTSKISGRLERIDRGCRLSRCLARWPVRLAIVATVLAGACMIAPVELAHREMAADAAAGTEPSATRPAIPDTAPAGEIAATNAEQKVIAAFREAVAPKYVAHVTAIDQATRAARELEMRHPQSTATSWRDDPKVKETGSALVRAVKTNWPFPDPLVGTDLNALHEQMATSTERPLRLKTSEAKAAFKDASDFRSQYHEGKATRGEAVARFVAVADKYPESYEHDRALVNAWGLCTQGLVNGAQADPATAASLMKRLAGRPGPPSAEVLMAELEVSGLNPDPAARLKERMALYDRSVTRLSPEWLTANMLLPLEDRSCSEYTARLQAVALHLSDMQYFAATGMASDAFVTSDSLGNLSLLAQRYEDDSLVLAAVEQRKQQMRGSPPAKVPETRPEGQPVTSSPWSPGAVSTHPSGFVAQQWGRAEGGLQCRLVIPHEGPSLPKLAPNKATLARLLVRNVSDRPIRLAEYNEVDGGFKPPDHWLVGLELVVTAQGSTSRFFMPDDRGYWTKISGRHTNLFIQPGRTNGFTINLQELVNDRGMKLLSLRGPCTLQASLHPVKSDRSESPAWTGQISSSQVVVEISDEAPASPLPWSPVHSTPGLGHLFFGPRRTSLTIDAYESKLRVRTGTEPPVFATLVLGTAGNNVSVLFDRMIDSARAVEHRHAALVLENDYGWSDPNASGMPLVIDVHEGKLRFRNWGPESLMEVRDGRVRITQTEAGRRTEFEFERMTLWPGERGLSSVNILSVGSGETTEGSTPATRPFAATQEGRSGDLPYEMAKARPAPVTASEPAPAAEGPSRTLDVRVVHLKTGEPIAETEAVFNFEGQPQVTLKTDAGGRCQFRYPDRPGHHGLNVQKAGLLSLSYWGDRVNSIPPNLTFKMEPGVGIGGFVKNSQGQPVAKAEVKVGVGSTRQEQLTGIRVNTYHEPVATDERGHWEVAGVPSDLSRLHVTAEHPDYLYRELSPGTGLPASQLLDKSAVIVLDKGIEVTGRLIDEEGKPIAELPVLGTETDQDGRFRAVGIEPRSQGFLIKVPGYLAHSVGTRIYAGMPPLEIRLQRAITVRGRVTDTAGNPVKDAVVNTQLQEWSRPHGGQPSPFGPYAMTDGDGRFVLEDMRPEEWTIEVSINNHLRLKHKLTLTPNDTPSELNLVLPPEMLGTIRGIVLAKDGVTPVAGAIIGNSLNMTSGLGTPTDENGRFALSGYHPGKHGFHVHSKGSAPVSFVAEIGADGTSPEQRIVLDKVGGTITGRAFDAVASTPLADEVIVACPQDNSGLDLGLHLRTLGAMNSLAQLEMFSFNGIHYRTQTGKDGSYQLANLPEGFYIVGLIRRSSTRHLWKELVHVGEGDVTTEVDLTVKREPAAAVKEAEPPPRPADKPAPGPAGSLSGIVYLPDGKTPAKGIKVAPYTKDRNRHNMLRNKIVITSAEGAFSFDGLAAGRYGVYAWLLEDNGFSREDLPTPPPAELNHVVPAWSSPIDVKPGRATTGVKVTLKEGAVVKGKVTDADTGQPVAGVHLVIFDIGAEYFLFVRVSDPRNPFDSGSRHTSTDAQGRYAFYNLPAQRYRLSASPEHSKYDQADLDRFTLKKGEDRTIDIPLQPARFATLTGRVLMPDGTPAAGAEVCVSSLSNKAIADAQGYYRHERVRVYSDPHTSPSIFARAENTAMTSVRAPKMKPGQTVPFDIRLLAGGTVTGRVIRADGSAPKDGTLACLMRAGGPGPEMSYRNVLKAEDRWEHFWVRVEPDGRYRLEHIPPNKYHLFALSDDKPHNIVKDLNIKDGATLKKDLKLSP